MTMCLQGQWEGIPSVCKARECKPHFRTALGHPQALMLLQSCPIWFFWEVSWHGFAVKLYLTGLVVAFTGAIATWKTHCPPTRRKPAARNVPQCLCFLQLPQSSLVAPKFYPLCRQSCRSSANWIPRGHSFWQISQTLPCKERILILYKAVLPAQQSLVLGGSLRAKIWGGKSKPLNQLFIVLQHCLSLKEELCPVSLVTLHVYCPCRIATAVIFLLLSVQV